MEGILEELKEAGEIEMHPFGLSGSGLRTLERLRLRSDPDRPTPLKLGITPSTPG